MVRVADDVELKKRVIGKFVQKIEVGTNSATIYIIVDREHFQRELKLRPRIAYASKSVENFRDLGSNTLTVERNARQSWYPGQDLNLHYLTERGPEPRVSTSSTTRAQMRTQLPKTICTPITYPKPST